MNITRPSLADGETYIGIIGNQHGHVYHLIRLPGDNDDATFTDALKWAKSIGGDLPSRIEQAMLWADRRDQFRKDWYWSNEVGHVNTNYVWYQCFVLGQQDATRKADKIRAIAVRRLVIE